MRLIKDGLEYYSQIDKTPPVWLDDYHYLHVDNIQNGKRQYYNTDELREIIDDLADEPDMQFFVATLAAIHHSTQAIRSFYQEMER